MRTTFLLAGVLTLILCGCDKKGGGGEAPSNPAELGKKIAADHQAMMKELDGILEGKPAPDALRPKIADLKKKYIQLHVASGKQRESLTPEDRQKCDGALRSALFSMDRETLKTLQAAVSEVRKQDNDLANELSSFNTLTQYAAYELLKKQLPEEAKRLGIQ
jgi:hypothetical protein